MKNEENKEPTQEELEQQAIEDISKDIAEYYIHVVTHIKFDENNRPFADPELKKYMKKGQEQAKKRIKYFKNKELAKKIKQLVEENIKYSTDFALKNAEKLRKNAELIEKHDELSTKAPNYIEDEIKPAEFYLFPRDRINNKLLNTPISDETELIIDEKGQKNSGVNSILYFNIESAVEETDLNERNITLSEFDKQVMNAIISLMRAGNKIITHQSIYQVLSHSSTSKLTDKWIESTDASMLKLNSIKITADFSNALKFYPELDIKKFKEKTNLLEFKEIEVQHRNGITGKGYKMLDEPVLYRIAEAKKQIGTISLKGLTNQKTAKSVDISVLYNWLLVRIDGMKHPKHPLSKTIRLDDMYSSLNKTTAKERRTTRENADLLLTQFKADKMIKDFEYVYENKKITKYNISV